MYKDLHTENYKMLMKEIKEDLISCSWIEKLNIVKLSILPQLIYKFNAVPIKIPAKFFVDTDNLVLKCSWKGKGPKLAKTILKKKKKVKRIIQLDVNTYYTAKVSRTV